MNKLWHSQHVLPRSASLQERLVWHQEHQQVCGCRPIPIRLLAALAHPNTARKNKQKEI